MYFVQIIHSSRFRLDHWCQGPWANKWGQKRKYHCILPPPPTEETKGQCPVVSHAASRYDTTVPDLPLYPSGSSSEALPSEPSKIPALVLPKQLKKNARKKVTIDDINEMHLAVLRKEHIKLALEIENLNLKTQEIMLRIQELESRSNVFSC